MPRRPSLLLLCLLLLAGISAPLRASGGLMASQAARAYADGRYAEAARLYTLMEGSGLEGADVHYDLGNCYLKQGDLGRAILEYHRALLYDPSMKPAQHNLEVARRLLPARVARWEPSPWESLLNRVPVRWLEVLVLLLVFLGNGALCVALFLNGGRLRRTLAAGVLATLVGAGIAGGLLAYARSVLPTHRPAVILKPASVYPRPDAAGQPMAVLPAGSEVVRIAQSEEWSLVLWGEGRGWTRSAAVGVP
ncbi:MAG: tetratricopeptide repeat protein [Acidobacteriota bacterium]